MGRRQNSGTQGGRQIRPTISGTMGGLRSEGQHLGASAQFSHPNEAIIGYICEKGIPRRLIKFVGDPEAPRLNTQTGPH